mmetsp:Transcript_30952/g.54282  ORF Transcript_30952/g.54282 Transcript_30952/m.54282 type:complete len:83 (-) Transcript_30952:279-527(-)
MMVIDLNANTAVSKTESRLSVSSRYVNSEVTHNNANIYSTIFNRLQGDCLDTQALTAISTTIVTVMTMFSTSRIGGSGIFLE